MQSLKYLALMGALLSGTSTLSVKPVFAGDQQEDHDTPKDGAPAVLPPPVNPPKPVEAPQPAEELGPREALKGEEFEKFKQAIGFAPKDGADEATQPDDITAINDAYKAIFGNKISVKIAAAVAKKINETSLDQEAKKAKQYVDLLAVKLSLYPNAEVSGIIENIKGPKADYLADKLEEIVNGQVDGVKKRLAAAQLLATFSPRDLLPYADKKHNSALEDVIEKIFIRSEEGEAGEKTSIITISSENLKKFLAGGDAVLSKAAEVSIPGLLLKNAFDALEGGESDDADGGFEKGNLKSFSVRLLNKLNGGELKFTASCAKNITNELYTKEGGSYISLVKSDSEALKNTLDSILDLSSVGERLNAAVKVVDFGQFGENDADKAIAKLVSEQKMFKVGDDEYSLAELAALKDSDALKAIKKIVLTDGIEFAVKCADEEVRQLSGFEKQINDILAKPSEFNDGFKALVAAINTKAVDETDKALKAIDAKNLADLKKLQAGKKLHKEGLIKTIESHEEELAKHKAEVDNHKGEASKTKTAFDNLQGKYNELEEEKNGIEAKKEILVKSFERIFSDYGVQSVDIESIEEENDILKPVGAVFTDLVESSAKYSGIVTAAREAGLDANFLKTAKNFREGIEKLKSSSGATNPAVIKAAETAAKLEGLREAAKEAGVNQDLSKANEVEIKKAIAAVKSAPPASGSGVSKEAIKAEVVNELLQTLKYKSIDELQAALAKIPGQPVPSQPPVAGGQGGAIFSEDFVKKSNGINSGKFSITFSGKPNTIKEVDLTTGDLTLERNGETKKVNLSKFEKTDLNAFAAALLGANKTAKDLFNQNAQGGAPSLPPSGKQ